MKLISRDLDLRIGERTLLRGVSFSVDAGEMVALIGPNGVGKTTWIRAAAGIVPPSAGAVELGGDSAHELARREAARRVALVPQTRPPVFSYTVLEIVLMGLHARLPRFGRVSQTQRDRAAAELERLEISDLAGRSLSSLSGGEAQRVLLARAAMSEAPIWLLDEPTANLDPRHQVSLLARVREHVDAGGLAICAMHDLGLVESHFDRVLVFAGEGLRADGPPAEVLTDELLSEVYGVSARRESRWAFDATNVTTE